MGCRNRLPLQPLGKRFLILLQRCAEEYVFKILFNSNEMNKFYFDFKYISKKHTPPENSSKPEPSLISHDYDLTLFQKFLGAIQPLKPSDQQPPFYFIHPILPHSPWEFYPSGKRYPAAQMVNLSADVLCENSPSLLYCQNTKRPRSTYQRHLLQAGFADTLLGQAIARLKAAHLYDQALIIVTADHGISFLPSEHRRPVNANNYGDIMPIPLLMKQPGQHFGKQDFRQAEAVDIVPTVAHRLQIGLRWHTDGESLLKEHAAPRNSHTICSPQVRLKFTAAQIQAAKEKALQRKLDYFGPLKLHPADIFDTGNHKGLIGQQVPSSHIAKASSIQFQLTQPADMRHERQPILLLGHVFPTSKPKQASDLLDTDLAVAVNNTIVAVSQPFNYNEAMNQADFAILLPEHAYNSGIDRLQLFEVQEREAYYYPVLPHNSPARP